MAGLPTTFVSETQLRATLDPSTHVAGVEPLSVANSIGVSNAVDFTFIVAVVPTITSLDPDSMMAPTGVPSSPRLVTVIGTDFDAGAVVEYDGVAADSAFVSATEVNGWYDPAILGAPEGGRFVDVVVRNGGGQVSDPASLLVSGTNSSTSVTPATFPEDTLTTLTITGTFNPLPVQVFIGATEFTVISNDITTVVAQGTVAAPGNKPVTVLDSDGWLTEEHTVDVTANAPLPSEVTGTFAWYPTGTAQTSQPHGTITRVGTADDAWADFPELLGSVPLILNGTDIGDRVRIANEGSFASVNGAWIGTATRVTIEPNNATGGIDSTALFASLDGTEVTLSWLGWT